MKYFLFLLIPLFSWATGASYDCKISSQNAYTYTTVSSQAVTANGNTRCLIIQNRSGNNALIKFGSVHTASEGLKLASGAMLEFSIPPMDSIYIESDFGTANVLVLRGE